MIKYYVNTKERTVTAAFVTKETGRPVSWFEQIVQKYLMGAIFGKNQQNLTQYQPLFADLQERINSIVKVGIARCHEDDIFDEEIGRKIAKAKLLMKWNNAVYNCTLFIKMYLHDEITKRYDSADRILSEVPRSVVQHHMTLLEACEQAGETEYVSEEEIARLRALEETKKD